MKPQIKPIASNQLLDKLIEKSNISPERIRNYVSLHSFKNDIDLTLFFVNEGWINRNLAGRIYAATIGFSYLNLNKTSFDQNILERIPQDIAEEKGIIPIYELNQVITVASSDPVNFNDFALLRDSFTKKISLVFSFPDEIKTAIKLQYQNHNNIDRFLDRFNFSELRAVNKKGEVNLDHLVHSKQLISLADAILFLGIKEKATDIHLEPKRHEVLIRFRIDGCIVDRLKLPIEIHTALCARYKIMASLNVVERRLPQDGRINLSLPSETIDLRISTLPTLLGEKIALRVLGSRFSQDMLRLEKMHFLPELLQPLRKVLNNPNGLLLVSGPTGSGKTTTLYGALNYINRPDINIVTIEDPVEYSNESINQVMINDKVGRSFSNILRSILRQDPDVILVGEIRDQETAKLVSQAALTGHMVLSSIHTGNALQAMTRLVEMGVERFIVAPAIIGVLGQRLVRKICEYCKVSKQMNREQTEEHFHISDGDKLPKMFMGKGCSHCNGTGYSGRIAIHEFLRIDSQIREYILQGREYHEVQDLVYQKGYKDLRYDGFKKAFMGLTTIEEVIRVTNDSFG